VVLGELAQQTAEAQTRLGLDEVALAFAARFAEVTSGRPARPPAVRAPDRRRAVEAALLLDERSDEAWSLDRSVAFYAAALAPLGHVLCSRDAASAGFGPPNAPALWLYAVAAPGARVHVALRATERAAVMRFHAAAVAAGGTDHGAAGVRVDYAENYYAAFVLDPDGNNVEAVCYA
jgi:catechol 2,3-dioxygenase-like lactoylglutathione lyase family enzyme